MQLSHFLISSTLSLREGLKEIDKNHHGVIFITDSFGSVTGLVTDGDIRRKLLKGASLDDSIGTMANPSFVWGTPNSSRESLLKKLDHHIKIIPILDENKNLVDIVSRDHLPLQIERRIYARSRAPVRVSFGGGGSDLTHYFQNEDGAVINATISLYSHATLRVRDDERVVIHSRDLGETFSADDLNEALEKKGRFGLIQSLLKSIRPEFGFDLYLDSDFPMASGLGGSAVVSASVLGCFNQFRRDQWNLHELAELAYQAERLYLGVSGGWQDQYASVFGGFNFMEFRMDQNIVHPLRIPPEILLELEESLVLCDTGIKHNSGDIHENQRQQMQQKDIYEQVKANVELTYAMRNQLLRGRLFEFGRSLDMAWKLKRKFSQMISTPHLDQIYIKALSEGAIGGKLLGAGGGGFFIFYAPPFCKHNLMQALGASGLEVKPFRFESEGLRAWTAREDDGFTE